MNFLYIWLFRRPSNNFGNCTSFLLLQGTSTVLTHNLALWKVAYAVIFELFALSVYGASHERSTESLVSLLSRKFIIKLKNIYRVLGCSFWVHDTFPLRWCRVLLRIYSLFNNHVLSIF
jgi:hypothetical protein